MWLLAFVVGIGLLTWIARRLRKPDPVTSPAVKHWQELTADKSVDIEQQNTSSPPAAILGMFSTPLEIHGEERLSRAYWTVLGELQGDGLSSSVMTALKSSFIAELGNSKKAGQLLATALDSADWDWPRWQSFAKREGHDTVSDVLAGLGDQDLQSLLRGTLKDDLIALASTFNIKIRKSMNKTEMIKMLMEVPHDQFEPWISETKKRARQDALWRVHCKMGDRIAMRVRNLAYEESRYETISDPDFLRFQPYWQFICDGPFPGQAPKKCRDLNEVILPAEEAMKIFPRLPCKRLDCHCRITTQRTPAAVNAIGIKDQITN